jgi:aminoglycoside phosphotransferase
MTCLIPEAKRAAVARGLTAAFGTPELDVPPVALSGGLSGARLLKIRVGGIAYALRLEGPTNSFGDPARSFGCMQTAADALLAPRVWHADPAEGLAIMDLVPTKSLALDYPGDGRGKLVELAQALRVLHATRPFPPLVDFMEGMGGLIAQQRATDLLPPGTTQAVFELFVGVAAVYRTRDEDRVSSHNDLNPNNVLYDGRRLWLIDWECAFLADRYVDLAAVANWFAADADGKDLLLRTYLGAEPSAEQRARFEVMRAVNHVYYGAIFLVAAAAERPDARWPEGTLADGPSLGALREGLRAGTFTMQPWENRVTYAKARLAQAQADMEAAGFSAALARAAA